MNLVGDIELKCTLQAEIMAFIIDTECKKNKLADGTASVSLIN